jgi:hypothetical protein
MLDANALQNVALPELRHMSHLRNVLVCVERVLALDCEILVVSVGQYSHTAHGVEQAAGIFSLPSCIYLVMPQSLLICTLNL